MSPEKQREIASKGGRAAHEKGTAHEWTADEARNRRPQGRPGEPRRTRTPDRPDATDDGRCRRQQSQTAAADNRAE